MAKTENTPNSNGSMTTFGEIGTIRDILMGQIIQEYNDRFVQMEDNIVQLEQSLEKIHHLVDVQLKDQIGLLEKNALARLDKHELIIKDMVQTLESKFTKSQQEDKIRLGKLLAELGKKLMDE